MSEKLEYSVDKYGYFLINGQKVYDFFGIKKEGVSCKTMIETCQSAGIYKKDIDPEEIYNSLGAYPLIQLWPDYVAALIVKRENEKDQDG